MTAPEIIEAARNQMNAVSDGLWSDTELYTYLTMCSAELALETRCIDQVDISLVSVSGQAEYTRPSLMSEIKRVTYDGRKLGPISKRERDSIVPDNSITLIGTPVWYDLFGDTITMYPTPGDSGKVIKFFGYGEQGPVTAVSTILTPTLYHYALVDGVTFRMCPKDLGHPLTTFFRDQWFKDIKQVQAHVKRKRTADSFGHVHAEEDLPTSDFGMI